MLHRSVKSVALVMLAALVAFAAFAPPLNASDARLRVKPLQWLEVGSIVPTDTTYLTDEADTTRTIPIQTDDWDWNAILASQLTGGTSCARVMFSANLNNAVTDTIYYTLEQGTGRDSAYTQNGTIVAAAGAVALSPTFSNVWIGSLQIDPDSAPGVNNAWLCPSFRLRVAGDQSGTTPKISGLRVYVIYPQRASDAGR